MRNRHTGILGFLETGLYGTASSAGYTAVAMIPVAGPYLAMSAAMSDTLTKLKLKYPNSKSSDLRKIAIVSGAIQGSLELLKARAIFGRFPTLEKAMNRWANPAFVGGPQRFGKRLVTTLAAENAMEAAQDLTTPLVQDVCAALGADIPWIKWEDIFYPFAEARPETFAALVPMVVLGVFGVSMHENRRLQSQPERLKIWKSVGFNSEQIAEIERGGTVEEKQAKARELIDQRTPEAIKEGIRMVEAEQDAANAKHFDPEQTGRLSPLLMSEEQDTGVLSLSFSKTNDGKSLPDFVNGIRPVRARSKFRIIRSGEAAVLAQAQRDLEALPEEVTTRDGRRVKIQHPAQGTVETLVTHLATSVNKRTNTTYADSVRAGWIPRIAQTLQEARVKVPQQNGNQIYITSYDDGYNHFVVVKPDGTIDAHGSADALWTQWARRKGEFFGFENSEYSRLGEEATRADASDVHGRKDDAQNVSGQSESAPPAPKGQNPAAPTNEKSATTSPSAQAKTVNSWVGNTTKNWRSDIRVLVHESASAIPDENLRRTVLEEGGTVEGFYNPADGSIHILADRMKSQTDVQRVLRHEGMHWAFANVLKKEYQELLAGSIAKIPDDRLDELLAKYPNASDTTIVEEYFAYEGQNNPQSTAWRNFVYETKLLLRKVFGDRVEFTDKDILAFLSKANRRLTDQKAGDRVNTSEGAAGQSDGLVSFAKAQPGMMLSQVGNDFVVDDVEPKKLPIPREMNDMVRMAAMEFQSWPEEILSADGSAIRMKVPEKGSLATRARHLISDSDSGALDPDKLAWLPNVQSTIINAAVRLIDPASNNRIYVRAYRGGTKHMVVVRANGTVESQKPFEGHLITQFPTGSKRQQSMVIDWSRPEGRK